MTGGRPAAAVGFVVLVLGFCPGHVADARRLARLVADPAEAAAPPPTVPSTTTTTAPPPPRSFTLIAGGDVLLHSPLWQQAAADAAAAGVPGYDFGPLLAGVAPVVTAADLAICHLETPLAPPEGPYYGFPVFSVPPAIAPALAATGFDACSTASNHVFDKGADGVDRTLAALDAAGIAHAGSARDPAEAARLTLLDAGGVAVGLLSYSNGFNGIPAPRGEEWRSNPIEEGRILADAALARQQGADVVVVSLHWGDEYRHGLSAQQADLAPRLIRSPDIDLLLGHHAHVVQPVELIDGEWVVYGMGNMIAHQGTLGSEKEEGLLLRFTFTETPAGWRVSDAAYTVVLAERDRSPRRLVDVGQSLLDPTSDPRFRPRLESAWDSSTAVVAERGAIDAGLHPVW